MRNKAFTLIELLIVIGILALLFALAFGVFARALRHSRATTAAAQIQMVDTALRVWMQDRGKNVPPIPLVGDDINALPQAVMGPAPAWYDGVDGPGYNSRIFYSATGATFQGSTMTPLIMMKVRQVESDAADFRLRYQVSLLASDDCPIIYAPIVGGQIPAAPGYVDESGVVRGYSGAYLLRDASAHRAKYVIAHPGPDRQFYAAGGVNDDVVHYGQ